MMKLRSICNRWGKKKLIIHSLVFVQCIKDEQEGWKFNGNAFLF